MDETAIVATTSGSDHRSVIGDLHARQDSNLRCPVLETGVIAARPRTHRGEIPVKRKTEALIPIAEATNGVRSRARPGAFIFQDLGRRYDLVPPTGFEPATLRLKVGGSGPD